ncbi:MAG: ParB N-terminal domain-containing protein [Spirochaetales bacterium]|nr:ParB N-terminal domain-containing protein [Spirochaetales bacterium]
MQMPINKIKISKRIRKDLGDLNSLENSMMKFGQFSPIIIDVNNELIAGHRRLEAAKKLGWSTVNVFIVRNTTDIEKLEIELEENIQRKELSPDEIEDGLNRLDKLIHPSLLQRIINFFKRIFKKLFKR